MDVFFAVLFFAFSSTITPGPNNLMILSSGLHYGVKASLPHLAGICCGFPLMVLLIGMGMGAVFDALPWLHIAIKVVGVIYLCWLAWRIATSPVSTLETQQNPPLSFWQALLFQWVNAKAWVMATGAVAAFTTVGGLLWWEVSQITLAFLLLSVPCVGCWLLFGAALRRFLTQALWQRLFNYLMAALLFGSMWPIFIELWQLASPLT